MKFTLDLNNFEIKDKFKQQIYKEVERIIIPLIQKRLKELDEEKIFEILKERIETCLSYGKYNEDYQLSGGWISEMLDKKLVKIVENLKDEDLKNMLVDRLIKKI